MKFSIVTCTRNSAQWVTESIDSVSSQTGVEIERIFVDGNSTDQTLEILEQVPGDVTILRGHTQGISEAMNAGANAATGDVIAHLHSDDYYVGPDVLATVAKHLNDNPDAGWLYGRCMNCIDGQDFPNHFETTPFSWDALLEANIVPHPATFIRRDLFEKTGGFSLDLKYVMDYDLWLRLAKENPPIQISDYLASFRIHDDGLSTAHLWRCHAECLAVRLKYVDGGALDSLTHRLRHTKVSLRMVRDIAFKRFGHDIRTTNSATS